MLCICFPFGLEKVPGDGVSPAIQFIREDGEAQVAKVDANLVRSASFGDYFNKRGVSISQKTTLPVGL